MWNTIANRSFINDTPVHMPNRRPTWRDIVFPLIVGGVSLATVVHRPRFASIHTVDALELIAAGVMFGLALRAFAMWLHDRLRPQ